MTKDESYLKERLRRTKIRKEKRKEKDNRTCKCGKNRKSSLHSCPYAIEMHNDYSQNCTCCNDCTNACKEDI